MYLHAEQWLNSNELDRSEHILKKKTGQSQHTRGYDSLGQECRRHSRLGHSGSVRDASSLLMLFFWIYLSLEDTSFSFSSPSSFYFKWPSNVGGFLMLAWAHLHRCGSGTTLSSMSGVHYLLMDLAKFRLPNQQLCAKQRLYHHHPAVTTHKVLIMKISRAVLPWMIVSRGLRWT